MLRLPRWGRVTTPHGPTGLARGPLLGGTAPARGPLGIARGGVNKMLTRFAASAIPALRCTFAGYPATRLIVPGKWPAVPVVATRPGRWLSVNVPRAAHAHPRNTR